MCECLQDIFQLKVSGFLHKILIQGILEDEIEWLSPVTLGLEPP